ncbi:MAG TPA: hypothetical protein VH480_09270 [Streptosporangiaceae bacterium]
MPNRFIAASLCLLGVALAGCAGSKPAAAGPGPLGSAPPTAPSAALPGQGGASLAKVQACKLVPAAVARQVLGPLDGPPVENGGTICLYNKAQGGSTGLVSLVVTGLSTYTFVKQADTQIAQKGTLKLRQAHGIGDDAFSTLVPAGPSYTLNAAKGQLAIAIHVNSGSAADQQQVRELMVAAIGRL